MSDPTVTVTSDTPEIVALRAQLEAAKADELADELSPQEAEHARLLAAVEDSRAKRAGALKARRAILAAPLLAKARGAAGRRYLVDYIDLAEKLPAANPDDLPGKGILIIRSPTKDASVQLAADTEANEKSQPQMMLELFLASVVYPSTEGAEGEALADFFEEGLGLGAATGLGVAVAKLGGLGSKAIKRGRGTA